MGKAFCAAAFLHSECVQLSVTLSQLKRLCRFKQSLNSDLLIAGKLFQPGLKVKATVGKVLKPARLITFTFDMLRAAARCPAELCLPATPRLPTQV